MAPLPSEAVSADARGAAAGREALRPAVDQARPRARCGASQSSTELPPHTAAAAGVRMCAPVNLHEYIPLEKELGQMGKSVGPDGWGAQYV